MTEAYISYKLTKRAFGSGELKIEQNQNDNTSNVAMDNTFRCHSHIWYYCFKVLDDCQLIVSDLVDIFIIEPGHEKMCLMAYANNKGADQPAHPRSLISAFVVRSSDSIISPDSIADISRLNLASVAAQVGLCMAWSETPEDTFCRVVVQLCKGAKVEFST